LPDYRSTRRFLGRIDKDVAKEKDRLARQRREEEIRHNKEGESQKGRLPSVWENEKTLIMKYKSHRGMIDFLVGLVKGVGRYFNENLTVTKRTNTEVEIVFS